VVSNKPLGSSFDEHFSEQFNDPQMARALYDTANEAFEKAEAALKEANRQLAIERAENARLHAIIKRKGL
jgi:hypothetical protein